jgi:SET domain-containing protein
MRKKHFNFSRKKHIQIKKSLIPKAGNGVFAKKTIPKGVFLGYYLGDIICEKEYDRLKNKAYIFAVVVPTVGKKTKEIFINALDTRISNWTRYVNGAKTKNQEHLINIEAIQEGFNICYYSLKQIKPGDELIMSYGEDYWAD